MNKNPIEKITIERNDPSRNANGDIVDNWEIYKQVYAELQIGSGREFFATRKIFAELEGLIITRQYISGIESTMRVTCSLGIFEIISAIDKHRQNKNELQVKKVV